MIYVLEDDNSIREFVVYTLCRMDLEAKGFERPSLFWRDLEKEKPSLILLDIMLPEEDGISVLKKLKKNDGTKELPVIMLTAKNTEYDKVLGLDTGADDYVAKPFGMMELVARIRALLRRSGVTEAAEYSYGGVEVHPDKHRVKSNGQNVELTLKEYELLLLLLKNKGLVFTRSQLLDNIWGYEFDGESRTVDVHIRTLRQKLGDAGGIIETVRGVGYRIGERE